MKKIIMMLTVLMLLGGCSTEKAKEFTVGVVQWDKHPALDDSYKGMIEGLEAQGLSERVSVNYKVANGSAPEADQIISQFVNDEVDVIYAIATPAAQSALSAVDGTNIKVVFAAVTDPIDANLVDSNGKSEIVTGVSDAAPMENHLNLIKEFNPSLSKVGVLFKTTEANSIVQIEQLKLIAPKLGVQIVDKGVNEHGDIPFAASQLANEVDAFYIITDNLIATAAGLVVSTAAQRNVPVFMAEDGKFDEGILAADSISYIKMGNQAGVMISNILTGAKKVSEMPFEISTETSLIVSQSMADKLGITIPQSILERAEVR